MNRLTGTVAHLETQGELSLVEIDVPGGRLASLVVESRESSGYLAPGLPVTVRFKESEVSIAVGPRPAISIRNKLPCAIRIVNEGAILTHLVLDFGGSPLHSVISTRSLHELGLSPGMAVHALIKATEVSLAEGHA